jgi:hypothetical protein
VACVFTFPEFPVVFRNTIVTPGNLEALPRIVDADLRIGPVRCLAFLYLRRLCDLPSIWSSALSDGYLFSSRMIGACAKFLDDEVKEGKILHRSGVQDARNNQGAARVSISIYTYI